MVVFGLALAGSLARAVDEVSLYDLIEKPLIVTADQETSRLLQTCPPSDCQYVSLGLTNTLFDSFLRVKLQAEGFDPKEILTYAPFLDLRNTLSSPLHPLKEEVFKSLLPRRAVKKMIFMRTLHSGLTIKTFFDGFVPYLKQHAPEVDLGAYLMIGPEKVISYLNWAFETNLPGLHKADLHLVQNENYVDQIAMRNYAEQEKNYLHSLDEFYQYRTIALNRIPPEEFGLLQKHFVLNPAAQELDDALRAYLADPAGGEFIPAPVAVTPSAPSSATSRRKNSASKRLLNLLQRGKSFLQKSCSQFLEDF